MNTDSAILQVKMLRGALSPHITDYTLEVKYEKEDDDFELIDSVTEGMKVCCTIFPFDSLSLSQNKL
jgi:hypothetical protein